MDFAPGRSIIVEQKYLTEIRKTAELARLSLRAMHDNLTNLELKLKAERKGRIASEREMERFKELKKVITGHLKLVNHVEEITENFETAKNHGMVCFCMVHGKEGPCI